MRTPLPGRSRIKWIGQNLNNTVAHEKEKCSYLVPTQVDIPVLVFLMSQVS